MRSENIYESGQRTPNSEYSFRNRCPLEQENVQLLPSPSSYAVNGVGGFVFGQLVRLKQDVFVRY